MTMTDLDSLTESADTGPECACGCGEFLPAGSNRQFKRGHKTAPAGDTGHVERPLRITIDEAAAGTPDDPEPPDQADSKPVIRITKRIRDDIEGKLAMIFGFLSMSIMVKDPICGNALQANADAIVPKLVPMICKSPDLVKWFTKGGGYMAWFELAMVCWPVIQVVISHHLTHSIGNPEQNGQAVPNATVTYDRYAA
jgi:hypothetical protein